MSRDGSSRPIRVLVVDDHQMVIDGLRAMLGNYPEGVEVVGACSTGAEALEAVARLAPDAVLLDVRLRGQSGLDVCSDIVAAAPACRVVFLTVYDDEQYLFQALRLGAAGFLLKRVGGAELVEHLRRACDGETVIDPSLAGRVALAAARLQSGEFWPGAHMGLSQRESEVLHLMVSGLSNRAIAQKLVVGEETVKSHVRAIYRKLDVTDRAQAVTIALREGLFH
ncbi:MAG TPA: response regulator transcription factor [Candidatus Dormibacteraeota bacterium]|nr:response regulator transcription factor [Candidatus Dormibacteraeota bacterium]